MNTRNEAKAILKLTNGDLKSALEIAERQLNIIYARAQVLLSLAGIVVTITGFSGRLIAGSSTLAQLFLISGLFVSLGSAIWVFLRVMRVRWVTVILEQNPEHALEEVLHRRNRKTKAYKAGGVILCLGMALYCVAISLMLLDPYIIHGPIR